MLATIALVEGDAAELNSLYTWLQRDDEFRGRVEAVPNRSKPGEMGGVTEMLTVAVGSGGAGAVLAGTLSAWVSSRRAKISVELAIDDTTRRVEIDAANAKTAVQLLRTAIETANKTS